MEAAHYDMRKVLVNRYPLHRDPLLLILFHGCTLRSNAPSCWRVAAVPVESRILVIDHEVRRYTQIHDGKDSLRQSFLTSSLVNDCGKTFLKRPHALGLPSELKLVATNNDTLYSHALQYIS